MSVSPSGPLGLGPRRSLNAPRTPSEVQPCSRARGLQRCCSHQRTSGKPGASHENAGLLQWVWVRSRTRGHARSRRAGGPPQVHVPWWSLFCLRGRMGGNAERKRRKRGWWGRDQEGDRHCVQSVVPRLPRLAPVAPPMASEASRSF